MISDAPKAQPDEQQPSAETARTDFLDKVFPREMEDIAARRIALRARRSSTGQPDGIEADDGVIQPLPTTRNNLVGLALSGGGMRSAAFNLGVLQCLEAYGLLDHADYLSTVSGGGWIGSCWSALTREKGSKFPFADGDPAQGAVVNHLRDRSSALVPSGLMSGAGLLAQFIRGIGATVVLLLPLASALALLSLPPMVIALRWQVSQHHAGILHPDFAWFFVLTRYCAAVSLAWFVASVPINSLVRHSDRLRSGIELSYRLAVVGVLFIAALEVQPLVVLEWASFTQSWNWEDRGNLALRIFTVALFVAVAWPALQRVVPILRALVLLTAMLLSITVPYLIYVNLTTNFVRVQVFTPGPHPAWYLLPTVWEYIGFIVLYAFTDVNVFSMHDYFRDRLVRIFILRRDPARGIVPDDGLKLGALNLPGSTAPVHILNTTLNLQASKDRTLRGRKSSLFVFTKHFVGSTRTGYCPTALYEDVIPRMGLATAMAISASAVSPNMGSMTIRPLVFLMTFLNLRMGYWLPNPRAIQRWAERSKYAVGEGVQHTFREKLNARLAWMPRLGCFLRELTSYMHEEGRWVYLSDGGHLENTGAYELLRRRCKCIVVSDAEEDGLMQFGGIVALMRRAWIDFGIEIKIDLDDLRPTQHGHSRKHFALAEVLYPQRSGFPAETGRLLYIKSSITGRETEIVSQYRAVNKTFPHQSTADQSFSEDQFEAYRALGYQIAEKISAQHNSDDDDTIDGWFNDLREQETPSAAHLDGLRDLRDEREEVETLLRDPACAGYFAELYPEFVGDEPQPAVLPAVLYQTVMRQIHLMSSVHARLRLDSLESQQHPWNQGWMSLFRRWSRAPGFRRVWVVAVPSIEAPFRRFCAASLDLRVTSGWSAVPARSVVTDAGGTVILRYAFRVFGDDTPRVGVDAAEATVKVEVRGEDALATVDSLAILPGSEEALSPEKAREKLRVALRELGLTVDGKSPLAARDPKTWLQTLVN